MPQSPREHLVVYINGKKYEIHDVQPEMTVLEYLREMGLTGTKLGCGEGGCGACTVMVSSVTGSKSEEQRIQHLAVNACLAPLCTVDGTFVTTIEGLGNTRSGLHILQKRFAEFHGSQCGYCTPGILMALYALFENSNASSSSTTGLSMEEIEHQFDGNLCRCTGYRPILDLAKSFANDCHTFSCDTHSSHTGSSCKATDNEEGLDPPLKKHCSGKGCASSTSSHSNVRDIEEMGEIVRTCSLSKILEVNAKETQKWTSVDMANEFLTSTLSSDELMIVGKNTTWYRPTRLDTLLELKSKYQDKCKLVIGNTELGIEMKLKLRQFDVLIHVNAVAELQSISTNDDPRGVFIGASMTLTELDQCCQALVRDYHVDQTQAFQAIHQMLQWFASTQIRNVAGLAGNIVTASPISDLNPILVASRARLHVQSQARGRRDVDIANFFTGYRQVDLQPDEILVSVFIPWTSSLEYISAFKQAKRREDDISIVTSGMRIRLDPTNLVIQDCAFVYGGMSATTKIAAEFQKFCMGTSWKTLDFDNMRLNDIHEYSNSDRDVPRESVLHQGLAVLSNEMALPENVPGGMKAFREILTQSFALKFFIHVQAQLELLNGRQSHDSHDISSFLTRARALSTGYQQYPLRKTLSHLQRARPVPHAYPDKEKKAGDTPVVVGQALVHQSAHVQVSGEAMYTDDETPANCCHSALVLSTIALGTIKTIDASRARAMTGVLGFFSAQNVAGHNDIGPVVKDEECFITSRVTSRGQVLGIVVAETLELARLGAEFGVEVTYDDESHESICSIEQAVAAKSFFDIDGHGISRGNLEKGFARSDIQVQGQVSIGAQEHFYLETNATLCIPREEGAMDILCSTQNTMKTQFHVARVLGVPCHKVKCSVKRMGGAFGGKETRSIFLSCAAAVAADKLQRPVKCTLERQVDMATTGTRHEFLGQYKVGVNATSGELQALDLQLYCNAGYSLDLSEAVMDRALFHCENAYYIPNLRVNGKVCRTNTMSNTAFRGFGAPQGMFIAETYVDHVACAIAAELVKKNSHVVAGSIHKALLRERNLYRAGQWTPYGQQLDVNFSLPELWTKAWTTYFDVEARQARVEEFNRKNKWKKRGLAVIPTKFGISFTAKFMNQGGALVHVYSDASVLVSHGGTEMGQGLHTKIIQIVAQSFDIPVSSVRINDTSTECVANSSPSAASMSTDLYGMAALDACEQILERLAPVRHEMMKEDEEVSWSDLVTRAYVSRINLSAQGFYIVPSNRCGYDWTPGLTQDDEEDEEESAPDVNHIRGQAFNYFTTGLSCSEVELDVLTGNCETLRSDVVMDIGASVNPTLDVGQIEGAFVQGLGLFTLEQVMIGHASQELGWISHPGQVITTGPGTYKIPTGNDVPLDFRVIIEERKSNAFAVHSSKAIGEPPLFLASSVFFAAKEAIVAARARDGGGGESSSSVESSSFLSLSSPLTPEKIRLACVVNHH